MLNNDAVLAYASCWLNEQDAFVVLFSIWSFSSALTLLALTGCFATWRESHETVGRRTILCATGMGSAMTAILVLCIDGKVYFPVVVGEIAAISVTSASLHAYWAKIACSHATGTLIRSLIVGQLCASGLFYASKMLGDAVQTVLLSVTTPLMGGVIYCMLYGKHARGPSVRSITDGIKYEVSACRFHQALLAGIATATLGVGVLWGSSANMRDHTFWVLGAVVVGVVYLLYLAVKDRPVRGDVILRAVFALLGVAILLAILVPTFSNMFMGLVWTGYSMLSLALFMIGRREGSSSKGNITVLGVAMSISAASIGVGLTLGRLSALYAPSIEVPSIVAIVLLLTVILFWGHGKEVTEVFPGVQSQSNPDDMLLSRCAKVAKDSDLTAAELETLFFFMKGYTIRRVSDERHVSANTIKTQISSIYRKLGIHSRQELLNIIERIGE